MGEVVGGLFEANALRRYALWYLFISCIGALLFPGKKYDQAVFLAIILSLHMFNLNLPNAPASASMSHVFISAVSMIFQPVEAAWLNMCGAIDRDEMMGRVRLKALLFNRVQIGAASFLSSWIYHDFASRSSPYINVIGYISAPFIMLVFNLTLVTIYLYLQDANSVRVFISYVKQILPGYLGVIPLTYVIIVVERQLGGLGIILLVTPIFSARYVLQRVIDFKNQMLDTLFSLVTALEARDEITFGHSQRVARLAVEVAKELGLKESDIEKVKIGALLHDIGKIGIPDNILYKRGQYTFEEFAIMATHTIIGEKIASSRILREVSSLIRHHHERFYGYGYPDGLKGEQIPIGARIIAVCDAFDAMISSRPYKDRMPLQEALGELRRNAGMQFDPRVVAALASVLERTDLKILLDLGSIGESGREVSEKQRGIFWRAFQRKLFERSVAASLAKEERQS